MKTANKIIAVLLSLLLTFGTLSITACATGYSVGDVIEFGNYPQTDVTATLGSVLNELGGKWRSYGYYSGSGSLNDGQMAPADYMRYKDVLYEGCKYRAVTFDTYRPDWSGYTSSASCSTSQDDNGYRAGNVYVYWFKFEPIRWRVLDPDTGLVMSVKMLDSQAYNAYILSYGVEDFTNSKLYWSDAEKTSYACNYEHSGIRAWLNADFYKTAFSAEQKANILTTELTSLCYDNIADGTAKEGYDSAVTNDKVFLLSYDEVLKSEYGFDTRAQYNDDARSFTGTDYAGSQGLSTGRYWWMRTAGYRTNFTCAANSDGYVYYYASVNNNAGGVVPAIRLQTLRNDTEGGWLEDEFEAYKEEKKADADALAQDGDSDACTAMIEAAKEAIDEVAFAENKSLDDNKAAVDAAADLTKLAEDLAAQRAAEQLAADKAAFDTYKAGRKAAADELAQTGDSPACQDLISDAKDAIDALTYKEDKTLDQNKAAADAIVDKLAADLAKQRDHEAFDTYKGIGKTDAEVMLKEDDTIACRDIVEAAKEAIDAVNYDDEKTLDENKTAVDIIMTELIANLAKQRDHDAFDAYKEEQKAAADKLLEEDDTDACRDIVDAAKEAIDAVTYDENKTLGQNKAAVDAAADLAQVAEDLSAQRESEKLERDKAAFERYKEAQSAKADELAEEGDSRESANIIAAAKEKIAAVTYDEDKTLDQNKAAVDAAADLTQVAEDLAAQRAAEKLAKDKAAFERYKEERSAKADELAEEGDSRESANIIAAAKEKIAAVTYDEDKTLDQNKAAVDAAADLTQVAEDLAAQRAAEKLAKDKAAFEEYKEKQIEALEALAEEGDSEESKELIAAAKEALEDLVYDENKSLEENKAVVSEVVTEAKADLEAQREAEEEAARPFKALRSLLDTLANMKWSSLFRTILDRLVALINAVISLCKTAVKA